MAFAPAGGEAALGAWTLVAALGFCVCAGLLWIWRNTIGAVFEEIASYKISLKWVGSIHPLAPLGKINTAVEGELSSWADACQKQAGLAWHYMAVLFWTTSHTLSSLSTATLDLGHDLIHQVIPEAINTAIEPWKTKTNKAAGAAGAAGALAALLKRVTRAEHAAQQAENAAQRAATSAAASAAHHAKAVATTAGHAAAHDGKVITQVIEAHALPVPFGRTVKQMWRLLRRHEALFGATAMAAVMANVLGLASPRCLRDGPIGRVSRRLCGLSSNALNDLLGLLADVLIVTDICQVIDLLNAGLSIIEGPIESFVGVVDEALCNGDFDAPPTLNVAALSLPPVTGINLSLA